MPERGFATETWDDAWFQELSPDQRYLFLYLWTNSHCNQAGLYHITLASMAFETKLDKEALPLLLESLSPKVIWHPEANLIWVKNFLKRQGKSPKFVVGAAKCLASINHNGAVKALIDYNLERYSLSIPYPYPIDSVSIPPGLVCSGLVSKEGGGVTGLAKEIRKVLMGLPATEDRLIEHESMKQALVDLGKREGLRGETEIRTSQGRVDVCWVDTKGEIIAAFEVDTYEPRKESIAKLRELACSASFIILRTNPVSFQWAENILLIGLHEEVEEELAIIAKLYEDHIGSISTPVIADKLKVFAEDYPAGWFQEALTEAIAAGVRKINYIEAILERWRSEGKSRKGGKAVEKGESVKRPFSAKNHVQG